ncbi:response regulator [Tenacibaculum haliotis]|uniref:response regulator n=1 Tax=Tenacibaculum haliotis TaxID=1888914 RepID=UPI0021B03BF6|nr:response regulator [Tenacibaculum haliotis]MCT4699600.1 response regulator [Tenacibaculum haliotis]
MKNNILIIHNDQSISHLIKMMLSNVNTTFKISNTYEGIKNILRVNKYDLIITDAAIKGSFVFQYLEDLKSMANNSPIIVMSEIDQEVIVSIAKKIGVSEFISFPFTQLDINSCINRYL